MMINRVGSFFMLVGLLLIGLYIASDIANEPVWYFLLIGMVLLGLGIILWFRNPGTPSQPSGRFRMLKSMGKKQGKQNSPRKG